MNLSSTVQPVVVAAVALLAGFTAGLLYFAALRRAISQWVAGNGWFEPVILTVCRVSGIVGVLALAVKSGAATLLVTFLGFLLARTVTLRRPRSAG